jgi:hypothetical protein
LILEHYRSFRIGRDQVPLVGLDVRLARKHTCCLSSTGHAILAGRFYLL